MIKILKKIFTYSLIISVSIIFITEIFLRIAYHEQLKNRISPLIYQPDSLLGYSYIPNVSAEINIPSIHKKFRINKNGFFGNSFEIEKKQGVFRIAIIGSSEASGIWMNSDENYCVQLQKMYSKINKDVEVLNFSMDGRVRATYNINVIKNIVMKYKPDLVLLQTSFPFIKGSFSRCNYKNYVITYNNLNPKSLEWSKAKVDYIESHKPLIGLYNISYIVRAACRYYMYHYGGGYAFNLGVFVQKKIQSFDIPFVPYSVKRTIEILKETDEKLKTINSELVLFFYYPNQYYKSLLNDNNLEHMFLDINVDESMSYENDSHFNEKGQYVIANALLENLKKYVDTTIHNN